MPTQNVANVPVQTGLSPTDAALARSLFRVTGTNDVVYHTQPSVHVPSNRAVYDVGAALDYAVFEHFRNKTVDVPVVLSVFFSDQFASVASRLASTSQASIFMSQVLGYALALRDQNRQREVQAAIATAAQTWGLSQDDVNQLITIATDRLNKIVTDAAASRFAASSLVGTNEAANAHELIAGSFHYDPADFEAARSALVVIMDTLRTTVDIASTLTQLRDLTSTIPTFQAIHRLVQYRYTYALPRTPMSLASLLASLRQYDPNAYEALQLPQRVPSPRGQYRYHTIHPVFAGSVTFADVMATLQALDRTLFALPVPNMDFATFVSSNVLAADSPFSPVLPAPGRNLMHSPAFQDTAKLALVADALSNRGSQLYSSLTAILDRWKPEKDTAAFFPEVRIMLEALICLVEHPLMVRNLLANILSRVDSFSMRYFPTEQAPANESNELVFSDRASVMVRKPVNKWIELREKGLQPLFERSYDPVSSSVLFSPVLGTALPSLLDFRLPSTATLGVAPWYGRNPDGGLAVNRIPITRQYKNLAVFTSTPPREYVHAEHLGPLSTLFPSAITHAAYIVSTTPVKASVDIGGLISHFPLRDLEQFGTRIMGTDGTIQESDLTLSAALQSYVLSSNLRIINGSSIPFMLAMSTRNYDQIAGPDNGQWGDIFGIASLPTATPLTDVPRLVSDEWYSVSDESFVVVFVYPKPLLHEVAEIDVPLASSPAPIVVFQEHPVAVATFATIESILQAADSGYTAPSFLAFSTPANPVPITVKGATQAPVEMTSTDTAEAGPEPAPESDLSAPGI